MVPPRAQQSSKYLEVSVHDALAVAVGQRLCDLREEEAGLCLGVQAPLHDVVIQLSPLGQLHDLAGPMGRAHAHTQWGEGGVVASGRGERDEDGGRIMRMLRRVTVCGARQRM